MRRIPSFALIIGIIVGAVVIGGGVGWYVSRSGDTDSTAKAPVVSSEIAKSETPTTVIPQPAVKSNTVAKIATASETDTEPTLPTIPPTATEQWQQALEDVLVSESEPEQKADRLLKMLPHLSEEAQVEVSQHLVNFVTDDHYVPLADIITNASTSEALSSVLMTDLLNRNDALKLPLLLAMARNESHPKHADAQNLLELYLQENYGNDWGKWEQSVTNWLAQNSADFHPAEAPEPTTGAQQ